MKIKSWGGQVRNREFHHVAEIGKKPFERFNVLGPFKIAGKRFVAAAYFNRWSYWSWILRNGITILVSFFNPYYYLKTTSLVPRVKGMMILDDDANTVSNAKLQLRVAKVALAWIDVYLSPVFPPRLFNLVDTTLRLEQKIFEQCKNRKTQIPRLYLRRSFFKNLGEPMNRSSNFIQSS